MAWLDGPSTLVGCGEMAQSGYCRFSIVVFDVHLSIILEKNATRLEPFDYVTLSNDLIAFINASLSPRGIGIISSKLENE